MARNRPIRYQARRSISDRLFFANLARPGAWYSRLWGMREHLVDPQLRTTPQPAFVMALRSPESASDKIPKLLRAYLAVGAKICGPPAIDGDFKTIDFLTLMDLETLHPRVYSRFMRI